MASVLQIIISARNDAAKELKQFNSDLAKIQKDTEALGKTMLAAGSIIVGALGLSARAAEDDRISVAALTNDLKNVGVAYSDVSKELEKNISATMRKTGYSDDEQRTALSDLILVTGNYQKALSVLPLALDLAAAKQMDVGTAATLLGKVAEGNYGTLTRYGIVIDKNATSSEALAAIQQRVAGAAQATASPFKVMQGQLQEMSVSLGNAVLPAITNFVGKLTNVINNLKEWADAHPTLIKWIGLLGLALVGAGGLLFAFSKIVGIVRSLSIAFAVMQSLSGPAGWAILAGSLAVAGVAIYGINKLMEDNNSATTQSTASLNDYSSALGDVATASWAQMDVNTKLADTWKDINDQSTITKSAVDMANMSVAEMTDYLKNMNQTVISFEDFINSKSGFGRFYSWQELYNTDTTGSASNLGIGTEQFATGMAGFQNWIAQNQKNGDTNSLYQQYFGDNWQDWANVSSTSNKTPANQLDPRVVANAIASTIVPNPVTPNITVNVQIGNKSITDAVVSSVIDEG